MPYYRKRRYRKRRSKRSYGYYRRFKRGGEVRLARRTISNLGTHYFKRTVAGTTLTNLYPIAGTGIQEVFKLSDLPNVSEFSNLFDQFTITKIVYKFYPISNSADAGTTNLIPTLRIGCDPDGGSDTTATELAQRKHKDIYLDRNKTFTVHNPSILRELYRSATTSTYEPKRGAWVDMSTTDVPFYSANFDWVYPVINSPEIKVEQTYYFKCKGVR